MRHLATTMTFSLVYIYYAYTGWNGASYLAGEIRNAQKILPRAILLGTAFVTILYLAVNIVYALALSAADIEALVKAPENKQGLDVVAPIAQIASERLFGLPVVKPAERGDRTDAPLDAQCLPFAGATGDLRDGADRAVSVHRRAAERPREYTRGGHLPPGGGHTGAALDRLL